MVDKLMKGHTWAKGQKKMTFPCYVEFKYDEIRLDVRRAPQEGLLLRSYADKPLHNLGLWGARMQSMMQAFDIERLDMGVIVNNSFNDTYRYVRSSKGSPSEYTNDMVRFILFDLPNDPRPFVVRVVQRARIANLLCDYGVPTFVPERHVAADAEEVLGYYERARHKGLEGIMAKSADHVYQAGKRTYGWLKVKPEEDADGVVHAIKEAVSESGEALGRVGSILVKMEDGSSAWVPGIDHATGRLWYESPQLILGQWVEFQYMMRDRQEGYRHPRFHRIREAKA